MPPNPPIAAVAHSPADVTPQWLSAALGRPVQVIERQETTSVWGAHVLLVALLAGEAEPLKLRVKVGDAKVFGRGEVDYYLSSFAGLADAPLVRCHHAAADDSHYHVLLDDLSDTHSNRDDPPVTEAYGRGLVESVAQLQAHRWALPPPDAGAIEASLREAQAGLPVMLDAMDKDFSAADKDTVRKVFDGLPQALVRRAQDPAGYSWVHGDLNPGNILAPRAGPGRVLLIDYQPFLQPPPTNALAISDLAHAMVLWWPRAGLSAPGRRAWWRTGMHSCSLAAPATRGTSGCAKTGSCAWRSNCWYRLHAAQNLAGVSEFAWLWQMHLRRVLAALN